MIQITFYNDDKDKHYTLTISEYVNWWLANQDSEGMQLNHYHIFEIIDNYFRKEL